MQTKNCSRCGTTYNQETVPYCPVCKLRIKGRNWGLIDKISDATKFMKSEISGRKRTLNSERRNDQIRYTRSTGKEIGRAYPK